MQIKLLQWNILYKEKIENTVKLLKDINPDIFCLQELGINCNYNPTVKSIPEYIANQLGVNYHYSFYSKADKSEMVAIANGVFSKFPILHKDSFFTQKPGKNPKSFSDEGKTYAEVDIKINESMLTVATAHLSYTHKFIVTDKKKAEVDNLLNHIKNKKEKYIFTGDLNSTPDSYIVSELSRYFVHAGPSYKEPTWTTKLFDYQGFREDKLRWRLDYVFTSKEIRIISSEIIKTNFSDHLPILVTCNI
ncbi:MAG: endonuclease/exonuclease/phosphatase family protein [bacterium]|nr:endonuclease/exonuclease/phosphatase family protein [bacterium]